jgi:formate hydrogenlyase transcriptional activator
MPTNMPDPGASKFIPFAYPDALSDPERLLAAFFDSSSAGLCILDNEFRYVAINSVLAAMNGLPPGDHLGKTVREMLGSFADIVEPKFHRVLSTGESVRNFEVSGVLPTRTEPGHWIEQYFPIKDANGTVTRIGVLAIEITEQKRMERRLEELASNLQKEKDRLQILREIDQALSSHASLPLLFPVIAACIGRVIPYDFAGTWLYDQAGQVIRIVALDSRVGEVFRAGETIPIAETIVGQSMMAGTPRSLNHADLMAVQAPIAKKFLELGIKSVCGLPLITPRGPLGALGLGSSQDRAFSAEDLDLLSHAATSIALALENAMTDAALVQEKDRLRILREIDAALLSNLDLQQVLPSVSACLQMTLPHDDIAVFLHDERENALRDYANTSELKRRILPEGGSLGLDDPLTSQIFVEGKTRVLNHAELVQVPFLVLQKAVDLGVRSVCFIPLRTAKGPLGVLMLVSHTDHAFGAEDVQFLKQVATALAQALGNALAHKALRMEEERLRVLLKTGASVASNLDIRQVFPSISAHVRHVKQHEFASLLLRDDAVGSLRRHAVDFPLAKKTLPPDFTVPVNNSPAGKALQLGKPLIFSKDDIAAFGTDLTNLILEEGLLSLCCVPLTSSEQSLGTLNFGSTRLNAFQPEDLELFNQIAAQIAVALENEHAYREIEQLKNRLAAEKQYLEGEIRTNWNFEEIIGESLALKHVLDLAATVAASNATVLVLGETGTGKELIARAIHRMSKRKDRNFIKVNCAAIPTGLLESELFGHEKGAFTGAIIQKIGRMELADGGTLFLDEVGEIPLELQPKLLRVLQDQEFERLGSVRTIKVDVRLVTATNRDLARSVAEREFRSDLFYRINVFPVTLPALRDRREDIPLLVRYFVRKFAERLDRTIETIPKEAMTALMEWHWPGNVRELENLMERSVILSDGPVLRVPLSELRMAGTEPAVQPDHTLDTTEREHILRVLRETGGVLAGPNGAARRLGVKRTTLQSKMNRLHIDRQEYSSRKRG